MIQSMVDATSGGASRVLVGVWVMIKCAHSQRVLVWLAGIFVESAA